MKSNRIIANLIFLALLFVSSASMAQVVPHDKLPPKPSPPRLVNDYANLLSASEKQALEAKLVAYNDSTSNQIVVVTVHTMQGYEADQYATEIGHYWGVGGQAKYDNGVVVLVSDGTEENGKRRFFIATGYGLEGAIPAITANSISQEFLIPNLKSGDYYEAFNQTTDAIIRAAAGEYKAPANYSKGKKKAVGGSILGVIIFVVIMIIVFRGRGGGGGGGGFMSRRGYSGGWLGPLILGNMLGNAGRSGGWGGGSGGGFGGGGGGGFGGFGGGGFGGGGSGGSW